MLTLVFLTLCLVLVLVGWGRLGALVLNRLGLAAPVDYSPFDTAVLGLFAVVNVALVLNFFIAISAALTYALIAIGAVGWVGAMRDLRCAAFAPRTAILVTVGFAVLYSVRFIEAGPSYDAGLYHLPYMNWVSAGPAPFGLANLEGRLGFNSSWLMFDAAFRTPYFGWLHLKVTESAIWTLASCVVFERLIRGWKTLPAAELSTLVALVSVFGIFAWRLGSSGVSSTDDAPNLFALLSALYFVDCFAALRASDRARAVASMLLHLCCAALAITGKLAMAPIALVSVYCLVLAIRHKHGRTVHALAIVPSLLLALWLVRGLVISGCAAYPVPFTCLETLSWVVHDPAAMVKTIVAWARNPGPDYLEALNSLNWVRPWAGRLLRESSPVRLALVLLIAGAVGVLLLRRRSVAAGSEMFSHTANVLGGLGALGLLLWFLSAPDPRFSWAFFILITIPLTAACVHHAGAASILERAAYVRARHISTILVALIAVLLVYYQVQFPSLRATMRIPAPAIVETRLQMSAVDVSRPVHRDQCWDTPIPCSPTLAKDLMVDHWMGRIRFRSNHRPEAPIVQH